MLVTTVPLVDLDSHGQVMVVGAVTEVVYPPQVLEPGVRVVVVCATTVCVLVTVTVVSGIV
jgi:hypothetical protein